MGPYDSAERHCWFNTCVKQGVSPASDCFTGDLVAQHGDMEKQFNTIEACAVKHYPKWQEYWPFVQCAEQNYHGVGLAGVKFCAAKAKLDFAALQSCASGSDGQEANAAQAKLTPDHPGVPYILINGQPVDDTNHLLAAVCKAYTGEKPAGCQGALELPAAAGGNLAAEKRIIFT
mmetsp:Transcript_20467/g.32640  ORF Transcript_20467/g.32640 Transcript_20467/m.32640 type:complete len:175 (-) Transcript_20467:79-603(-)